MTGDRSEREREQSIERKNSEPQSTASADSVLDSDQLFIYVLIKLYPCGSSNGEKKFPGTVN